MLLEETPKVFKGFSATLLVVKGEAQRLRVAVDSNFKEPAGAITHGVPRTRKAADLGQGEAIGFGILFQGDEGNFLVHGVPLIGATGYSGLSPSLLFWYCSIGHNDGPFIFEFAHDLVKCALDGLHGFGKAEGNGGNDDKPGSGIYLHIEQGSAENGGSGGGEEYIPGPGKEEVEAMLVFLMPGGKERLYAVRVTLQEFIRKL